MKRRPKILAFTLAVVILISLLAGCSGAQSTTTTSTSQNTTSSTTSISTDHTFVLNEDGSFVSGGVKFPLAEKKTYTFFITPDATTMDITGGDINNNTFWQEFERLTNVHFDFITPAVGTEREQYNLTISSGDLPDIMSDPDYYQDGLDNGLEEGYFLDLTALLPVYAPEYMDLLMGSGEENNVKTDSGRYASMAMIYNHVQPPFAGFVIRKDWLDDLGLSVPETYEEWETVLTAFKNEKGSETPLSLTKFGYWSLGSGYEAIGDGFGTTRYQKDGIVYDSLLDNSEGCKEYFAMMNRWYDEALIDQNFMTTTGFFPDANFLNSGMSGIAQTMFSLVDTALRPVKEAGGELVAVPWPVKNSGDVLQTNPLAGMSGTVFPSITISAECEDPETLMAAFNYLFTEPGYMLENYGIEAEQYTLDTDGKYIYTDLMLENISKGLRLYTMPPSWGPSWVDVDRQDQALPASSVAMMETWTTSIEYALPQFLSLTSEENAEYADLSADITTYIEENCLQFITGSKSMDEWDSFVATLESMGLDRVKEIYQQSLNRYNAR